MTGRTPSPPPGGAMTPTEERLLAGETAGKFAVLYDACLHGELTESQAREFLEGDALEIALRVIESGLVLPRSPEYLEWRQRLTEQQEAL